MANARPLEPRLPGRLAAVGRAEVDDGPLLLAAVRGRALGQDRCPGGRRSRRRRRLRGRPAEP
eukprot:1406313-Alexandrium_andersonii.AAC.1